MPALSGTFGTVTITGNTICIEINPGCLGSIDG